MAKYFTSSIGSRVLHGKWPSLYDLFINRFLSWLSMIL
jgi:hypothetical protein